jgi:scyllo-inositol 2-dehydrogenase (NADP+)
MTDIRVAMIGYGLGGQAFHAPFIATTPGMKLTTIVTANADRGANAQRDFPDAQVLGAAEEVWRRAGEHDLVVIVTANRAHVPLALAAIDAGLAVVVDKPLAANVADARKLVEHAKNKGVPLSVYHERRWDGEFLTAQRLVAEGALGQVLRFESRLDRWRPQPKAGAWRELGDAADAGGLLFDLGSHLIDQALVLFGPVAQVYAEVEKQRTGVAVDDDVFISMRHVSGVLSHLWTTSVAAQPGARLRVMGSRAAYVKMHGDVQELALRSGVLPNTPGFGEDPKERWGLLGAGEDARPIQTAPGDYKQFYARAVTWLREGAPAPVNPDDAVAGLRIIEAAQRSAAERRVVALSS